MLKKLYDSNKKLIVIIIVLLIALYIMPPLLRRPYELKRSVPVNQQIGKAGETVEFELIIEQINGYKREYVIRDVEIYEGDWKFSNNVTSFYVQPDSIVIIYITIKISEDAQNEDRYGMDFGCYEKEDEAERVNSCGSTLWVTVDNRDPPEIEVDPGFLYHNGSGYGPYVSPLIFIPLIVVIFCMYLLIMALTEYRHKLPPTPGRENK